MRRGVKIEDVLLAATVPGRACGLITGGARGGGRMMGVQLASWCFLLQGKEQLMGISI